MKIALLIPSTSRGRDWQSVQETYLFNYTIKTLEITYDKEHEYRFYIGIDRGDSVYDKKRSPAISRSVCFGDTKYQY